MAGGRPTEGYAMQGELGCSGLWSGKRRGEGENGRERREAGQKETEKVEEGTGEEVGDPVWLSRGGSSLFYDKKAGG